VERPFHLDKDPVYQNLLGAKGWALRAENLLFEDKVDTVALEKALLQLRNAARSALMRFYKLEESWNKKT